MEKRGTYRYFLTDDDFISWRLTGDPGLAAWWEGYLTEHPAHKPGFDKAVRIMDSVRIHGESLTFQEKEALRVRILESAAKFSRRKRIKRLSVAAAACLAVVWGMVQGVNDEREADTGIGSVIGHIADTEKIVISSRTGHVYTFESDIDVEVGKGGEIVASDTSHRALKSVFAPEEITTLTVPFGRRAKLRLSDGSTVWVNSDSRITFPITFTGNKRKIEVSGEAYIEVTHDPGNEFTVISDCFDVQVYGTKFNITAYDGEPGALVLVEGSVAVTTKDSRIMVSPRERIEVDGGGFLKQSVDVSQFISWKDGYLIFSETPMDEVLTKISRYYNISFVAENSEKLHSVKCIGKIYLSSDINNVMRTVSILSSSRFRQEDGDMYLDFDRKP